METELDTAYRIREHLQTFGTEWVNLPVPEEGYRFGVQSTLGITKRGRNPIVFILFMRAGEKCHTKMFDNV